MARMKAPRSRLPGFFRRWHLAIQEYRTIQWVNRELFGKLLWCSAELRANRAAWRRIVHKSRTNRVRSTPAHGVGVAVLPLADRV